ncbi:hypothetical protein H096_25556 [Pseudomonas sp. FH1]|nr:hypothetical protein H096_25556 [Pseudomonas sp. FH1]
MKFPVVVHKDADSDYGVTIPDVPGCLSAGRSFSEALHNVREALALHLEGVIADQEQLPQVLAIDVHLNNPDFFGGFWAIVDLDLMPYLRNTTQANIIYPTDSP